MSHKPQAWTTLTASVFSIRSVNLGRSAGRCCDWCLAGDFKSIFLTSSRVNAFMSALFLAGFLPFYLLIRCFVSPASGCSYCSCPVFFYLGAYMHYHNVLLYEPLLMYLEDCEPEDGCLRISNKDGWLDFDFDSIDCESNASIGWVAERAWKELLTVYCVI